MQPFLDETQEMRMFFDSWAGVVRIAIVGTLAYAALVLLLRVSGKRTLTKLNAFDLVVTVALGSTLATVLLNKSVSFAEGVTALALLIFLQYAVTWTSVRWPSVQAGVKADPSLLVLRGKMLDGALRRERITREEVWAALRAQDIAAVEQVQAVVLETDGSLSVLTAPVPDEAMRSVRGWPG